MASEVDGGETVSEVMAQLAEAEAAEAEALADAARAKATVARLRGSPETPDTEDVAEAIADEVADEVADEPARRWWARLPWSKIGLAAVIVAICAVLTLTGLMIWQHRQVTAQRAHEAEFVTSASEGVVALLSIDYNHAKADVQKVIDHSTGSFRDDFTKGADDFVKTAEQSKAVTVGKISAAALESENGDTGVVLLAASSQVTNANGARQDPRAWRMSVTMTRDGGKLKMSNVEFVP
jgi:Mce-associated membrane protein